MYYFFCLYLEFSLEEILSLSNSLWKKDKTLILLKKDIIHNSSYPVNQDMNFILIVVISCFPDLTCKIVHFNS